MSPTIDQPATWVEWGKMDQELDLLMNKNPNPAFHKTPDIDTVVSTREEWYPKYKAFADKSLEASNGLVTVREIQIPRRDGVMQRALLYQPSNLTDKPRPLLVMIHGGGFCFGCPEMEAGTCIGAARNYGCVAISLSYRLAPEHKFPSATDDCWDALQWISMNYASLGADPTKGFVLGGTSAGGNISLVLAHQARDENLQPPLTGLYLNVPLVLAPEAVKDEYISLYKSRDQNALAPVLNKAFMDMYTEAYAPDLESYIWSPFNWPIRGDSHACLPPTYFQICGLDVLRDEGLIYERVLRLEFGIETKVDVYPGLPHMFVPNFPTHSSSEKYPKDTLAGVGWLFRG